MDIVTKKMPADKDEVRIAELDDISYRQKLWSQVPLTDSSSRCHIIFANGFFRRRTHIAG